MINNSNLHIIITISLVIALIAIIIFGPPVESNQYESELNYLKQTNQLLIFKNDSISSLNDTLQQEITRNLLLIDSTVKVLELSKNEKDYDVVYPSVGENMSFLRRIIKKNNLMINYLIREEDKYCWQFSNKGYFNFKSNIPKILSQFKLN